MATINLTIFPFTFPAWFPPERETSPVRELDKVRELAPVREVDYT